MPNIRRHTLSILGLSMLLLCGCQAVGSRLGLRPSIPIATPVVSPGEREATPVPSPSQSPSATSPAEAATPLAGGQPRGFGLVFVRDGWVMRGDSLGAAAIELIPLRNMEAWDLRAGRIALLQGALLHIVDLDIGATWSIPISTSASPQRSLAIWGDTGKELLHVGIVADPTTRGTGRRAEFRSIDVERGAVSDPMVLSDVPGVTVLRYDDAQRQALVVLREEDAPFSQVDLLDLAADQVITSYPIRGEGQAVVSPDGSRLLTFRRASRSSGVVIYHLNGGWHVPQAWEAPKDMEPTSCCWSPDGNSVACLVSPNMGGASDSSAPRLWVLNAETMAASSLDVAADALLGWLPSGEGLLVGMSSSEGALQYYVAPLDGGAPAPVAVGADARILGWASQAASAPAMASSSFEEGWQASYYDGPSPLGAPALVRTEAQLAHDWGTEPPAEDLPADGFSARWRREVTFSEGTYAFTLRADDGARLWMDGIPLIDAWGNDSGLAHTADVDLAAGPHDLQVEFHDDEGPAAVALSWASISQATLVDDGDAGFEMTGEPAGIYERRTGYGDHMYWTWNSQAEVINSATWRPSLTEPGQYEVQIYVPGRYRSTNRATYSIHHAGETSEVNVDQAACSEQWISLGVYRFAGGADEYVMLSDATGEPYATTMIAFDAVRFLPSSDPAE